MSLIKNRRFAALITAAVCVISLHFGYWRSANARARAVSDMWVKGVYNAQENYTPTSAGSYYEKKKDAAFGLYTTGSVILGEDNDAVKQLLYVYMSKTHPSSKDSEDLDSAFYGLISALRAAPDSEPFRANISEFESEFRGAGEALLREAARYYVEADKFRRECREFPLGIMRFYIPIDVL